MGLLSYISMGFKVGDSRFKKRDVFVKVPDANVTHVAEQAPNLTSGMVVVNVETNISNLTTTTRLATDDTQATLCGVDRVPSAKRHAVVKSKEAGPRSTFELKFLFSSCGIFRDYFILQESSMSCRLHAAARLMRNSCVEAVLDSAVLAWLKNPLPRALSSRSSHFTCCESLSPFVKFCETTLLALRSDAVLFLSGAAEFFNWKNLLASGAKSFPYLLLREEMAIVSGVSQEPKSRNLFTAPGTGHFSGLCFIGSRQCRFSFYDFCNQFIKQGLSCQRKS